MNNNSSSLTIFIQNFHAMYRDHRDY